MTDTNALRNGYVTATATATCLACAQPLPPGRARRYCNDRCRQGGWRRRHSNSEQLATLPDPVSRQATTVYMCPECDTRYLGEQRCADCNKFCTRLGTGGPCPSCDELVTIGDLTP